MLKLKPAQWDTVWIAFVLALFTLPGATAGHPTPLAGVITLAVVAWLRASWQADSKRNRLIQLVVSILIVAGSLILSAGAAKDKWGLTDGPVDGKPTATEKAADKTSK